jgi:hypothetical protein
MAKKKKKPLFVIDPDSEIKASGNGYKYVTTTPDHPHGEKGRKGDHDKKYVYLHRALKELQMGKYLDPAVWEVHHKDRNPKNNALSNLEVVKFKEHQRDHALTNNKFWKKSPRTKPRKKSRKASVYNVVIAFLEQQ